MEVDPFQTGPGKQVILDLLGIDAERENQIMTVTCQVTEFTVEAKHGPLSAAGRGYCQLKPENLQVHINIDDPAKAVREEDDLDILATVIRSVAAKVNAAVLMAVHQGVDAKIAADDLARRTSNTGVQIKGKVRKEVEPETPGEAL